MSEESDLMDDLFGSRLLWKNKYRLRWCDLCETIAIQCPSCKNISCSGGGCDKCLEDDPEWQKTKHHIQDYLSPEEIKAVAKASYLKDFIRESLAAGFTEINWKWLNDNGHFSQASFKLFSKETEGLDPEAYQKINGPVV